jgi:hypothetical protein
VPELDDFLKDLKNGRTGEGVEKMETQELMAEAEERDFYIKASV